MSDADTLARYRAEFEERFNLHYTLIYYVWTFFFLMVDQRAKNMFLTYWASEGRWMPYLYDNDTCLGINNEGQMSFDFYHEDTDFLEDGSKVYNGQDSVLWNKFRVAFAYEIQECYKELRSEGKLSYEAVHKFFVEGQSDKWSEAIYNEDSDFKYISMLREEGDATNLPQIRGTGEHHLEYFLSGRLNYCDSKWYAMDYANDFIVLRVNTPTVTGNIKPNANITVTPFSHMYAGVRYRANGTLQQQRVARNEAYTFIAPADNFNDTETAVYGASQISSLGDLAPLYCNYVDVSKATKLIELKVGDEDETYESRLVTLSLGTNRLLKKLDIRNCKSLVSPVDLSGCPNIEEVYAEGSGITGLELADSGYLRVVHLPETLTTLTVKNQQFIEDFEVKSYANIKELSIEDTPNLPISDILLNTPLLERTRLINVEWSTNEADLALVYEKLLACGGIDETGANINSAVVSGIVSVPSISQELLGKINTDFPELMVSVNGVILCTVSYYNADGTLLYVTTVERGKDAIDIVKEGIIDTPTRENTLDYRYEYKGWSDDLTNIQRSKAFVAMFHTFYGVRFYNEDVLLYNTYVEYGAAIDDPIGIIAVPTKESTVSHDYTFERWDNDLTLITGVTDIHAVFTETLRSYEVKFYNDDVLLESKLVEYGTMAMYEGATPTKLNVTYPQDYTFLGWTPALDIVKGEATYVAKFSESDHILDDWATVSASVADGTYKEKYPLGILQRVDLSNGETIDVELVGYDSDVTEDGKVAGLTFITKGCLYDKQMMSDRETLNRGGWEASYMRTYLNNTILSYLPSDLLSEIKPVVKVSSTGAGTSSADDVAETVDKLWTPALIEMVNEYTDVPVYSAEGKTYEWFDVDEVTANERRVKMHGSGSAIRYWLRTPVAYQTSEYQLIGSNGENVNIYVSYSKQGVVFGFCIGAE